MRVKNGPLFYRMGLISISILYYQRATFPNEPKSKLAEFTPIALNARIMVEKVTLFPLSILEICALLTPINSPSCACVKFLDSLVRLMASPIKKLLISSSYLLRSGVPFHQLLYPMPLLLYKISSLPYLFTF